MVSTAAAGHDAKITRQREGQTGSRRHPVDHGDRRLWHAVQQSRGLAVMQQRIRTILLGGPLRLGALRCAAQITAGAERGACAREYHTSDALVGRRARDRFEQLIMQLLRKRVELLRSIQRQDKHSPLGAR